MYAHIHVCTPVYVCSGAHKARDVKFPEAGVIGRWEPFDVDAGN